MSSSCHICGNVIASACGGCGNVSYCGRDCQRKDWKNHKNQCKCYKITKDQSLHGNHVIAARFVSNNYSGLLHYQHLTFHFLFTLHYNL